jgi:antitoxin component of MazEF toxin-antitoxin module
MLTSRIQTLGNSVALVLSPEMLHAMGLNSGDEVDIILIDRTLIVRPLEEAERAERINTLTQTLLTRRASAYERLAQGG